ncbi:Tetratricopeptide repeat protein [Desulfarculales bacterium]
MLSKHKAKLIMALAALLALTRALPAQAASQEFLDHAAVAYGKRADLKSARQAVELYVQALAADPNSEEAAWKLSRAWYWVGSHLPEDQALEPFEKAMEAAKQAVAINQGSLPGHYWLGVAYGSYGKAKGIMKSLSLVDLIKEEMAWVINKDPAYEAGGPYRVLGRLYFKLPGLMGGSTDKAIQNLQTAIQHGPRRWLNHIYLAEAYIKAGKKELAKPLLEQVLAGQAEAGLEPELADWQAEARKLLQGL